MERNIVKSSIVAPVDLTGQEYLAVMPDGNLTAALGDTVYGIVYEGASTTDTSTIVTEGEWYARVGEAVVAKDVLTGGAAGKLMKVTKDATSGGLQQAPFAIALEAGAADDVITVKLI